MVSNSNYEVRPTATQLQTYVALPVEDPMDGERAVSYRFYVPAKTAAAY